MLFEHFASYQYPSAMVHKLKLCPGYILETHIFSDSNIMLPTVILRYVHFMYFLKPTVYL